MAQNLEGKEASLWVETTPQTHYPKLTSDDTVYDLLVVGGGITGVMAAYYAQKRGLKTALIEKGRLLEWTTGGTTAKLSSQHYLIYDYLIKRHGKETAQAFADANERGINRVEELSKLLNIDCEFLRRSSYVYTNDASKVKNIKTELEATVSLGLPSSFKTDIGLPFEVEAAIQFSDQAQFHPRKFLLGIIEEFVKNGGVVYEGTEATDITQGDVNTVSTNQGEMQAKHVLQASGKPFWHGEIFDGHMWVKMSYALAVTLKDPEAYPKGMYITTDHPMRTIRTAEYEGKPVMIFGGESHESDDDNFDPESHHKNLIEDVRKKFDVDEVLFRWFADDFMPYDRIPYIGVMPENPTVYTITGFRAWGLAWAMSATEAIIDDITGSPAEWVKPFSLDRLKESVSEEDKKQRF